MGEPTFAAVTFGGLGISSYADETESDEKYGSRRETFNPPKKELVHETAQIETSKTVPKIFKKFFIIRSNRQIALNVNTTNILKFTLRFTSYNILYEKSKCQVNIRFATSFLKKLDKKSEKNHIELFCG